MHTATVVHIENYRKTAVPEVPGAGESPADARRAPDPEPFRYPPARPMVDWMPGRDDMEARVDDAFRILAFIAAAGAGAILAGAVLSTVAGAFAVALAGV